MSENRDDAGEGTPPGRHGWTLSARARTYSLTIAFCAVLLGLLGGGYPGAAIVGAAGPGALTILQKRRTALAVTVAVLPGFWLWPEARTSLAFWCYLGLSLSAGMLPRRMIPVLLRQPNATWQGLMIAVTIAVCCTTLARGWVVDAAAVVGVLCSALLGAGLARHLAMLDARLLVWGEQGLVSVTRDLLLGRVTSGMLHDLAQPLNVISMANGNLGYIIDRLDIDETRRGQLDERIRRIAEHTQGAARILDLFRWFGRDGAGERGQLDVRGALERAVEATRSNVRHRDVQVNVRGSALSYPIPEQHGSLEMMSVAALLAAFAAFIGVDGAKNAGAVSIDADLTPGHVVVTVRCVHQDGEAVCPKQLDHATQWLVEQVAAEARGEFRYRRGGGEGDCFVIRLARGEA